jgi:hypothetical protein
MRASPSLVLVGLLACNGEVASDQDAGDAATFDATNDVASDAKLDAAAADAANDAASEGAPQCAFSIPSVDDAGVCHGGGQTLDCVAEDPSFDRCVVAYLHELDGAAFVAMQCFDSDAETGEAVCCNAVNPTGAVILVDPSSTCCPGPAPDGGTAACDPSKHCVASNGGWTCQ